MSAFKQYKKRNTDTWELKRNEILQAYQSVVASVGFEAASMAMVSKQADIPTSLIFHYFKNKLDLTHSLVNSIIAECIRDSIPKVNRDNPDKIGEFHTYIDALLDIRQNKHNYDPRVFNACSGLGAYDEVVAEKFESYYAVAFESLEESLAYFDEAGIIRVDDPQLAARFAVLLVDGLENVWSTWQKISVSHELITIEAKKVLLEYLHFQEKMV